MKTVFKIVLTIIVLNFVNNWNKEEPQDNKRNYQLTVDEETKEKYVNEVFKIFRLEDDELEIIYDKSNNFINENHI